MIRTLLLLWRHRNTPTAELVEINRLLVKAGRRCAYDLRHAAAKVQRGEGIGGSKYYYRRAAMWLDVFNPGDDGKNYRDGLHQEISDLNREIERLQKVCEKHGINHEDPNRIPF